MDASRYSAVETLREGDPILVRAIRADDKRALVDMFERLSPETIYHRFLGAKKRLTRDELVYLTELDFRRRAALVAVIEREGEERIVGVGRYASASDSPANRAEVAITVEDGEQRRGIGTLLLKHLRAVANAEGIRLFDVYLVSDNLAPIALFEGSGHVVQRSAGAGTCHLVISTQR
jgi:GNAT superfamily N-acetyltransferase